MGKKKTSAFDIVNNVEHFKSMMTVSQILGAFISEVAIPQGMKRKDFMMICEEMWNMCPYIDHTKDEK